MAAAIQPIIMRWSAPVLTSAFQLAWSRAEVRTARVTVRDKAGSEGHGMAAEGS